MKPSARSTYRLLKPHALPYVGPLLFVVFLGALSAAGQRLVYLLIKPTWAVLFPEEVQEVAATPRVTGILGGFNETMDRVFASFQSLVLGPPELRADADRMQLLLRVVIVVGIIAVFTAVVQFTFLCVARWASLKMIVGLRMRLARHLMGLSLRYHGKAHFGDLLSRISADVDRTLDVVTRALQDLVQQPLLALFSVVAAFAIAPLPTLVVVLGLPILAIPFSIFARKVRKRSTKSLTNLGASVQVLSQMFQGVRTVKAFRAEEREMERYAAVNESYVKSTMKMVRAMAMATSWTLAFSHVGLGILLLVIGWLSLNTGQFESGGDMLTFFMLISGLQSNVKSTTRVLTRAQESVGASERLLELLEQDAEIQERPGAHGLKGLGAGIRFEDVGFTYPEAAEPAVDSLSLELPAGGTLALVGASGAGKSTVMDLVARFIDPQQGRVTVDGNDLRDVSLDDWTSLYAMVGQTPFLFHDTIDANIRYGKPNATQDEVESAARAAGIHEFIEGLPDGYQTDVASAGTRLSGGQRQRITIARAFLKGAPLLLLDEATSALDPETEARIQEALERLMSDRTVVVIAHRLSTIRNADRIAVLSEGRLVEIGSHDELLAREDGVYRRMHVAQHPLEAARAES